MSQNGQTHFKNLAVNCITVYSESKNSLGPVYPFYSFDVKDDNQNHWDVSNSYTWHFSKSSMS